MPACFVPLLSRELFVFAGSFADTFISVCRDSLLVLFPAQEQKASNDDDPIQIIRDHRTICRAVLPSEERIKYAPTTLPVFEGRAALFLAVSNDGHKPQVRKAPTLTCQTLFRMS
jgi:hypothetical protein